MGDKYDSYVKWVLVYNMIISKQHFTCEGRLKIRELIGKQGPPPLRGPNPEGGLGHSRAKLSNLLYCLALACCACTGGSAAVVIQKSALLKFNYMLETLSL